MKITKENYFDKQVGLEFSGSTQIKTFMECEYKFLQTIKGDYEENKDAFLMGNYMDAHFDNELDIFKAKHPELFKKSGGELLQKYENISVAIQAVENDEVMLNLFVGGKTQQIFMGEIEGVKIKIMVDNLLADKAVDRKFMKDFGDCYSSEELQYVSWWKMYRYDIQAAIYNEILKQNGIDVPFEIAAISKEKTPDKAWIRFSAETLENALEEVKYALPKLKAVREGLIEPTKCGKCDCCKQAKKLTQYVEV